jgi:hypothetical protein
MFISVLSPSGEHLLGGFSQGQVEGQSIAADAAGNVFVTGTAESAADVGGAEIGGPYPAAFLVKYAAP